MKDNVGMVEEETAVKAPGVAWLTSGEAVARYGADALVRAQLAGARNKLQHMGGGNFARVWLEDDVKGG